MSMETTFLRSMTPAMAKAADELEARLFFMGEDSPEHRTVSELCDRMRVVQLIMQTLGVEPTAADILAAVKFYFERERFEYLKPDLDGPLPDNVVMFDQPA